MDYLLNLDKNIFLYFNNLGSPKWDQLWLFITNKWSSIPLYIVLLYLLYKKLSLNSFLIILVLVALLITCTDQTANIFKSNFQRLRPCQLPFNDRSIANCGKFGFFSAHAASSMSLAVFLGFTLRRYYKFIFIGLLIWSFLLGYSRIYVGVHYPGDVIVGFLIGALYGGVFHQLNKFLNQKIPFLSRFKSVKYTGNNN